MEKFQGYKDELCQNKCLYPLLFQEFIYALAYDSDLKASFFYESVENWMGSDNKYSLVLVKRLIIQMHHQNDFINHPKLNSFLEEAPLFYYHIYSKMTSEGFGVVVEIPLSLQISSSLEKRKIQKEIGRLQNLRSIHSIFSFLEDKLSHFNYVLDILIPYPIHFEILIQILQYWIQDVPFLHLLRFFFLEYLNWNTFITSKDLVFIFSRLFQFLYNSYVSEYESVFLFLHKKSSYLRLTCFGIFLERINFYGKIEHFRIVYLTSLPTTLWFFIDSFMHYVRHQGKAILSSRETLLLMKKWKFYLVCFWQYSFHFWFQPNRIFIKKFSNYWFYFLGYLLSVKKNTLIVKSQILEVSILIDTVNNKLDTRVPVIPLIKLLSKATFCTVSGHPISKPIWIDLSDHDILNRFGRIYRNLFHYYSGSSKKRGLYRIKYILRLSCARTLARKHKSTVRTFMQKFGAMLLEEFFTEEQQALSLVFQKTILFSLHKSSRERIWYLDILCINDLVNHLEFWS